MKRSRYTETQIINILKEAEAGIGLEELSRKYGFSKSAFYKWKSQYSGMDVNGLRRLKELEDKNRRLKQMYAELSLEHQALKNVDVAFYNYLKTVADGSVKAGISTGTLQNGGVGLASFHDWQNFIPADLTGQIQSASDGIKDGSINIDLP